MVSNDIKKVFISAGLFYPSKLGGPANTQYWLAKGLISRGVDVSAVATNDFIEKGLVEFDRWTSIDNIRVRYCTTKSKLHLRLIWNSIIEMRKCKTIILPSLFYIPSFFIALFAVFNSKKIIWSPRGQLFDSAIKGSSVKKLYIKLLNLCFAKKVVFHATSEEEEIKIKEYFGVKVKTVVIPNYMELPTTQNKDKSREKYFLFVGRIAPIKALDNMLLGLEKSEVFMCSDYKFYIVGGVEPQFEEYNNQLQQILSENELLKDKVIFLGNVEGEEKYKLYANAYFSLLVSHSENFGNVIIEALSQGTPVIASYGTPWQQLNEKQAGFWINNSIDEITSCINRAIDMGDETYLQYRNNASKLAKEFDVYENVDKWVEVLKNI